MTKYTEVPASEVTSGLRWDVPGRNQGQIVEVAYANPGHAAPADEGDPWKRITDTSEPVNSPARIRYLRRDR